MYLCYNVSEAPALSVFIVDSSVLKNGGRRLFRNICNDLLDHIPEDCSFRVSSSWILFNTEIFYYVRWIDCHRPTIFTQFSLQLLILQEHSSGASSSIIRIIFSTLRLILNLEADVPSKRLFVPNTMELNSWEANKCSATERIPNNLASVV
jgi:hypothetical protein